MVSTPFTIDYTHMQSKMKKALRGNANTVHWL